MWCNVVQEHFLVLLVSTCVTRRVFDSFLTSYTITVWRVDALGTAAQEDFCPIWMDDGLHTNWTPNIWNKLVAELWQLLLLVERQYRKQLWWQIQVVVFFVFFVTGAHWSLGFRKAVFLKTIKVDSDSIGTKSIWFSPADHGIGALGTECCPALEFHGRNIGACPTHIVLLFIIFANVVILMFSWTMYKSLRRPR